ncbi:MAG: alpha/beta fold hydrolase [Gemmataceae bacterium]
MNAQLDAYRTSDGYKVFVHRYTPSDTPRGRVVYLHGIQSHAGWYEQSCRALTQAGFGVEFLERRGSGRNTQARGDTPSWRRLVEDIVELLDQGPPAVLLSVSWGCKLAVALEQCYPGRTQGLGLITPGICTQLRPPLVTRLRIGGAWWFAPSRTERVGADDPALFTSNPQRQAFIRDDPLSLRRATARFFIESVRLDAAIAQARLRVPVLLMLAGQDRITDNERTKQYVSRLQAPEVQVIEYPQASHTLEFEPDPTAVFRDLVTWVEKQCVQPA